jgi:hypothetical protein
VIRSKHVQVQSLKNMSPQDVGPSRGGASAGNARLDHLSLVTNLQDAPAFWRQSSWHARAPLDVAKQGASSHSKNVICTGTVWELQHNLTARNVQGHKFPNYLKALSSATMA